MTDNLSLKTQSRETVGTNSSKALRNQGLMPAVVYGHGLEAVSIAVGLHDLTEGLHHGHRIFDVNIDGKKETVLVKDIQYDYLGRDIIHADFVRVNMSEKVSVTVELNFKGTAEGAAQGGILGTHLTELEIECRVSAIPEVIDVPVKDVNVGDSIYARDIELPEGAVLVTDPDALVLNCNVVTVAEPEEGEEGEGPVSPEVITEKKEESESE